MEVIYTQFSSKLGIPYTIGSEFLVGIQQYLEKNYPRYGLSKFWIF
jgi:hypothetical protein